MPQRSGKSEAENAAGKAATGDVVVNVDACIRVPRQALKALVRVFADPTVGVASGRDVSVGAVSEEGNGAESGYVGYEMWVRSLETRLGSIVGASGCFYGIRRDIHDTRFPAELSRDFASALIAREHGLRAVSVEDAVCFVPRTTALRAEYRRKVRTMARGLATLWYKRHLMNPVTHGLFAFMLLSHKLCRWLGYLLLVPATLALLWLATQSAVALALAVVAVAVTVLGVVALRWPEGLRVPRVLALPGFAVASTVAGMLAWLELLRGRRASIWEPTRRPA
jgi:cellulose synthase/poly-beta-1,6-N-acetylglucosamine synthase-like glycosyltransferase